MFFYMASISNGESFIYFKTDADCETTEHILKEWHAQKWTVEILKQFFELGGYSFDVCEEGYADRIIFL